jgi:lipoprotein-releasing system permease protein
MYNNSSLKNIYYAQQKAAYQNTIERSCMNFLSILLAWRYLLGTKTEKTISTMAIICFAGIVIGSCSLLLVLSIMRGFEQVTHEKMQGIHSQLIMRSFGKTFDADLVGHVLTKEFPEVAAYSPCMVKQIIVHSESDDENTAVIVLKGIEPSTEHLVSTFHTKITHHLPITDTDSLLKSLTHENGIIIGQTLAENLDLKIGDTITLLFATDNQSSNKKLYLESSTAIISGIFKTGIDDFDASMAISSLSFLQTLYPDAGVDQINMQLIQGADEDAVIAHLKSRFGLPIYSWKDLYTPLVSALKLEKYAMFFILALITLVASMNIISLLFMQITQKRSDIAILQAMGIEPRILTRAFIMLGMFISCIGSLCGLTLATIICILLQRYPFITLPDAYFVTYLPVVLEWQMFALIFILVMALSLLASWLPARATRSINISQVLRYEG